MTIGVEPRRARASVFAMSAAVLLAGCGQPPPSAGGPSTISSANPSAGSAALTHRARPELAMLGPDERRVALLVLPGDASVEVDGQPASRRNGAIDLIGKVGDVRRVRVWKGQRTTDERAVTIQDGRPSPLIIDLNEAPPAKAPGRGPKKAASYGGFDD